MNELHGKIALKIKEQQVQRWLSEHVGGYDPARFEIVAIRLFSGEELIMTVFVRDMANNGASLHEGKVPVKKFKIQVTSPLDLLEITESFNFTVCNDEYKLDEMEVINK